MPSFEQQLENARKEGKEIGKRAKEQGHPAAPLPGSESLAQEQEINEHDITAQPLDDILKQPITFTDKEGNVTETCEHIEDVLETKEGEKICEAFAKDMASNAQNGRDSGFEARNFITAYSAMMRLPQEQQDKIEAVFAREYGSDLSTAITNVREILAKELVACTENGRNRGVSAWHFITAYSSMTSLPQEQQDKITALFTQAYGSDLSTAITNVHETFVKYMASDAQAGRNWGLNARTFIRSLTATKALRDHYQKLSTEQNKQIELTDTTDTTEPLIPQKNF